MRALTAAHTMVRPAVVFPAWPEASKATITPSLRSYFTKITGAPLLRERDFFNAHVGHRLAVAVAFADALLRFIVENHDLTVFELASDARGHAGFGHERRSDQKIGAVVREKHPIENDLGRRVSRDAIEANHVAFLNLKLSSIGFDDGEHQV